MVKRTEIEELTRAVTARCVSFLQEEMGLAVEAVTCQLKGVTRLVLRDLTALVSVGGSPGVYIAFSFDEPAIRYIFRTYTHDLNLDPEQEAQHMAKTAADVVNTIVGNALAKVHGQIAAISMTPPVVLAETKSLVIHRDAYFYLVDVRTNLGDIDIMYIGPKALFDEMLQPVRNA